MQSFHFKQNADGTWCVMSYRGDEPDVVIPDTYGGGPITIINDKLFAGHKEIRSVRIPDTVTDIGEFVFDGCLSLRSLELPSRLSSLWGHTFTRSGLEEITLPDSLRSIPYFAFKDCKNLRKVVCGSGMKWIRAWAFCGCDQLTELVYSENVEISPDAFKDKPSGNP